MATRRFMVLLLFVLTVYFGPATALLGCDESLVGEWLVESTQLAGKKEEANPPGVIRITEDQILLINADKTELELEYSLDRSKTPQEIDLTFELDKGNGPFKVAMKGIIKVEDGRALLCLNGNPKGERPKEFKNGTKENGFMVFKLKRASDGDKRNVPAYERPR